jgi:hypothetical protein
MKEEDRLEPMFGRKFVKKLEISCAMLAVLVCLGAPGVRAQQNPGPQAGQPGQQVRPATPQERRMLDLPPEWADQLRNMTPEQQEQFLANNQRFQNLPPAQQARIRQQLQVWNSLSPAQRQALEQRQQVFQSMTSGQQRYIRNTLLPEWQHMRPDRRQAILKRLRDLRALNAPQRAARLNDPYFLNGLDRAERQMLRDLANLRVPLPETAQAPPPLPE